jgi:dienelactone hydrolase
MADHSSVAMPAIHLLKATTSRRPTHAAPGHRLLASAQIVVGVGMLAAALISDRSDLGRLVGALVAAGAGSVLATVTVRGSDVARGAAALVGGILGVGFGGGIGPAWLATTGVSLVAVVEIAALIAGLLLLVAGGWLLVRFLPGWWRLSAIPLAYLLLQFVLLPLAGATYGTHPPPTPLSAAQPDDAEPVAFETADGVTLGAWYTPPADGAAPGAVIIVLPGSGGDKGSTLSHAEVLARHGYGTLALDSRGTGDSGGVGNAWGWRGAQDVAAAIDWLSTRSEVDAALIGILGLSMGGEIALTAAAADLGLAAAVAEGVSARIPADLSYLPGDLQGTIERIDGEVMWALADLMTDAPMPVPLTEAVAAADGEVPTLIVVANDPAEAAAAPILAQAAPGLRFWEVPDAPHIGSLAVHPAAWEETVVGFLDGVLTAAPS